jgi:chromosome segregation ATPase
MVQTELKRRAKENFNHSSASPFSSKIICGECGGVYGSKVWHSNDKYRRVIWQCNNKFKNKKKCKTPHLTEEEIKKEFVKAFNNLISNKDEVIKECENTILSLADTKDLDTKITKLKEEINTTVGLMRRLVYENSRKVINQDEYNREYDSYLKTYEELKTELSKLKDKKNEFKARVDKINMFISNLKNNNKLITEFDEKLWYAVVEKVVINVDKHIVFKFKNSN